MSFESKPAYKVFLFHSAAILYRELFRASRRLVLVRVLFFIRYAVGVFQLYPRDFGGAACQLATTWIFVPSRGKVEGRKTDPNFNHPNSRNPGRRASRNFSLASTIRSHVAIPSRQERRIVPLCFLRDEPTFASAWRGASLPLLPPSNPSLFIVPPRISALFAVLSIARVNPATLHPP